MRQDRVVNLEGAVNFRDFGGYETSDGERLKGGCLFRCGAMSGLTETGREAFLELDIGLICDLRRADERDDDPTPFPEHLQLHLPIDPGSAVQMRDTSANPRLNHEQRIAFMRGINVELARDHAAEYRRMFDALLALDEAAFLVHCTAGKDRTGFGVAIIQLALGVPKELVIEDYLLTNEVIDFETFLLPKVRARYGAQVSLDDVRAVSGVREEYIHAALDTVDEVHGGVDQYLDEALGVGPAVRDQLRERFLD